MNNNLAKIILAVIIFSSFSFAQSNGFGLGVILGEPTGISAKYWTSSSTAFDFIVGYSFEKIVICTYTLIIYSIQKNIFNSSENIALYYGHGVWYFFN